MKKILLIIGLVSITFASTDFNGSWVCNKVNKKIEIKVEDNTFDIIKDGESMKKFMIPFTRTLGSELKFEKKVVDEKTMELVIKMIQDDGVVKHLDEKVYLIVENSKKGLMKFFKEDRHLETINCTKN